MELSKEALAAARETLAEIESRMPPGPAFILAINDQLKTLAVLPHCRFPDDVPEGYLWQDATDHAPAGWIRPTGKYNRTTGSGAVGRQIPADR